jgi:hypothetical protein
MKIEIEKVRSAFNKICDHLAASGVKEVEDDSNFYWKLSDEQLYDMSLTQDQIRLVVGCLTDDWEFISHLFETGNEDPPVPYQLTEIAPLIYAIGFIAAKKGIY